MLEIVKYPAQILDEVMPQFDFDNPIMDPKEMKEQMLEAMFANGGVGLSAPQVGIKTAAFVMGSVQYKDQAQICINPTILDASPDSILDWEGCLSFPNVIMKVKRPSWLIVEYQNEEGEVVNGKIEGYDARCYLHECDHLNGIIYKDRVTKPKWDMAVKRAKKIQKEQEIKYA